MRAEEPERSPSFGPSAIGASSSVEELLAVRLVSYSRRPPGVDWMVLALSRRGAAPSILRSRGYFRSLLDSPPDEVHAPGEPEAPADLHGRLLAVSWLCPHCAMLFDEQRDRDDHVTVLHPAPEGQEQQP